MEQDEEGFLRDLADEMDYALVRHAYSVPASLVWAWAHLLRGSLPARRVEPVIQLRSEVA